MADPIDDKPRCFGSHSELYAHYHDTEWGVPVHDDRMLFEMLILEGAHAGLSWETILKKRDGYREVYHGFDVDRVADMTDFELYQALQNPAIVRHRQKVPGARQNARVAGGNGITNWDSHSNIAKTHAMQAEIMDQPTAALIADLKKRGMTFVGPTIIYAYLQAVGIVNDHWQGCWITRERP